MRQFCALLTFATWAIAAIAEGAIVRWDTREVIPGTESITLGPGVQIDHRELEFADLRLVDLTGATLEQSNLTSADFYATRLDNANLRGANLTRARLYGAVLIGTDLTDAIVEGAGLGVAVSNGLTREQFYSTASYKSRQLPGIQLGLNELSHWDFSQQNLSGSSFGFARLVETDFSRANLSNSDFREARFDRTNFRQANLTGATDIRGLGGDFTDAIITGASMVIGYDQLTRTASYKLKELPGVGLFGDLRGWNLSGQNLAGVRLGDQLDGAVFANANLTNATLREGSLVGANFHNANLSGAEFFGSKLHGADFSDALIPNAKLLSAAHLGFTREQLYSTASYKQGQLPGIDLGSNDLSGWNFSGQNLSGAKFSMAKIERANLAGANLNGAILTLSKLRQVDFTGASVVATDFRDSDLRSAVGFVPDSTTILTNTIWPDGGIRDFNIFNAVVEIPDYDMPITMIDQFEMANGTLSLILEDGDWGSTIVTRADDVPTLSNGRLFIGFLSSTTTLYALEGTTFDLFDWGQPLAPGNRFSSVHTRPGTTWDLSRLYDTGEVTLLTVPEPGSWLLLIVAFLAVGVMYMRNYRKPT